jgi:hypothetical protein
VTFAEKLVKLRPEPVAVHTVLDGVHHTAPSPSTGVMRQAFGASLGSGALPPALTALPRKPSSLRHDLTLRLDSESPGSACSPALPCDTEMYSDEFEEYFQALVRQGGVGRGSASESLVFPSHASVSGFASPGLDAIDHDDASEPLVVVPNLTRLRMPVSNTHYDSESESMAGFASAAAVRLAAGVPGQWQDSCNDVDDGLLTSSSMLFASATPWAASTSTNPSEASLGRQGSANPFWQTAGSGQSSLPVSFGSSAGNAVPPTTTTSALTTRRHRGRPRLARDAVKLEQSTSSREPERPRGGPSMSVRGGVWRHASARSWIDSESESTRTPGPASGSVRVGMVTNLNALRYVSDSDALDYSIPGDPAAAVASGGACDRDLSHVPSHPGSWSITTTVIPLLPGEVRTFM